jgi:hypothetical protein
VFFMFADAVPHHISLLLPLLLLLLLLPDRLE